MSEEIKRILGLYHYELARRIRIMEEDAENGRIDIRDYSDYIEELEHRMNEIEKEINIENTHSHLEN